MRGGYRESAASDLRFNDRQIEWIETTSSVADVREFLNGADPLREDAADTNVFFRAAAALALAVGGGLMATGEGAVSVVGVIALLASAIFGLVAGIRYAARSYRARDEAFEILTFVPKFQRRVLEREEHDASPVTYVEVKGRRRVWPERLESLRVSLGQEERIRVCIVHRDGRTFIEWAFPV